MSSSDDIRLATATGIGTSQALTVALCDDRLHVSSACRSHPPGQCEGRGCKDVPRRGLNQRVHVGDVQMGDVAVGH